MDQYSPISNPYRPVLVPYLGGQYDGLDFAGYPSRHNWDIGRLEEGDFQGASRRDAAQFLQRWMYFGLLHEVLDMPIAVADFFRPDGPQDYVITTAKLPGYLQRWKIQLDNMQPAAREAQNDRAIEVLSSCYYVWRGFVEREREHGTPNPIPPEIELSIQILATTLEHCLNVAFDVSVALMSWRLVRNPWLTRRMIGDGWCPSVIEQIFDPSHLAVQNYASLLGPPVRPLDHSTCRAGNRGCNARIVDDAVYVTRHKTDLCECGFLGVNIGDLSRIVGASGIPLVKVTWGDSGPSLALVPWQDGMKYTAISHVWSDGLGNPRENALPVCQVNEIERLITALNPNEQPGNNDEHVRSPTLEAEFQSLFLAQKKPGQQQYFWMDTLCVPVKPLELRKAAIKKMRDVYSRADKVLVLDEDLMGSTANTTYEEIFTRISCCIWIRRLWTLQEAVLAKTRHFQFAERAVVIDFDSDLGQAQAANMNAQNDFCKEVGWFCYGYHFDWRAIASHFNRREQINMVWYSLPHRSTSKPADESVCIATLLDMDIAQLLDTPDDQKVKKLWSMHVHGVPAAVLFLAGTRLSDPGYRWAPDSYMHCGKYGIPMAFTGTVTPHGFDVVLPGFTLSTPQTPTREVIACDLDGQTFFIRRNLKRDNPSWEGLEMHKLENLAVILGQERMPGGRERRPLVACIGALVVVEREEEGMLRVRYVRMVSVIGKGSTFDRFPNPPWSEREGVEKGRVGTARWRRVDQRWCVG